MDTAEFRLLEAVGKLQDRQLAWTRELVAIPTVNPYSGDEWFAGARAVALVLHRLLREWAGRQ